MLARSSQCHVSHSSTVLSRMWRHTGAWCRKKSIEKAGSLARAECWLCRLSASSYGVYQQYSLGYHVTAVEHLNHKKMISVERSHTRSRAICFRWWWQQLPTTEIHKAHQCQVCNLCMPCKNTCDVYFVMSSTVLPPRLDIPQTQ